MISFFDFLKFLNIENFKLQKIELLNEITLEEEDKMLNKFSLEEIANFSFGKQIEESVINLCIKV